MNELQQNEFEILKYFSEFSKKHDIKYSLYAGTLLGAIRHSGFIPWDDDIDVSLLRKDFEKFEKKFIKSDYILDGYIYQSRKVYPYNVQPFSKIRNKKMNIKERMPETQKGNYGPWIDLFPIDNVPDDLQKRREQYEKVTYYNNIIKKIMFFQVIPENKGIKRKIKMILQKINDKIYPLYFFMPYLYRKRDKYMTMYNDIETLHVANLSYLYYKNFDDYSKQVFLKKDLESVTTTRFESEYFYIPQNYDKILTQMYGDYMTFPPESERKKHNIEEV